MTFKKKCETFTRLIMVSVLLIGHSPKLTVILGSLDVGSFAPRYQYYYKLWDLKIGSAFEALFYELRFDMGYL
jgi:hypothetical protein